jgi:hypothetical protein
MVALAAASMRLIRPFHKNSSEDSWNEGTKNAPSRKAIVDYKPGMVA